MATPPSEDDFTLVAKTGDTLELGLYQNGIWIFIEDNNVGDCSSVGVSPDEVDQIIENLTRLKNVFLAR